MTANVETWEDSRESCHVLSGPHDYDISASLVLPSGVGGSVVGVGGGQYFAPGHAMRSCSSVLLWRGNSRSAAIEMRGLEQSVDSLSVCDAPIGILFRKGELGLRTGKSVIRDTWLTNCKVGVQCAVAEEEYDCDSLRLDRVFFHDCKTGFRVTNAEGTGHTVLSTWFRSDQDDSTCFLFEGGGNLWATGVTICKASCVLKIDGRRAISPSSAQYTISGIRIDADAGPCRIVDVTEPSPCQVAVRDCHVAYSSYHKNSAPMFSLSGSSSLTVDNFYNLQRGAIRWADQPRRGTNDTPNIAIYRSRVNGCENVLDLLDASNSSGAAYLVVQDCFDMQGNPLADFSGPVDSDPGIEE